MRQIGQRGVKACLLTEYGIHCGCRCSRLNGGLFLLVVMKSPSFFFVAVISRTLPLFVAVVLAALLVSVSDVCRSCCCFATFDESNLEKVMQIRIFLNLQERCVTGVVL